MGEPSPPDLGPVSRLQTELLLHFITGHTAAVRKAYMVLTETFVVCQGRGWRQTFPCIYSCRDMSERQVPCGQGLHLAARTADSSGGGLRCP